MQSRSYNTDHQRALLTLEDIMRTLDQLMEWNSEVEKVDDFYSSQHGMQLLAADCMLITAIGEGVNRINRILPDFLTSNFPHIPWQAIVGMRNHLAHGYFELDAELVFETIKNDLPPLNEVIATAISILK